MKLHIVASGLLMLLTAGLAAAAGEQPAIDTMRASAGEGAGTTIVGERDSAVGLYLTPWKEEAPSDIDRPPKLYSFQPEAIDAQRFAERTQADDANAAYRRVRVEPRL